MCSACVQHQKGGEGWKLRLGVCSYLITADSLRGKSYSEQIASSLFILLSVERSALSFPGSRRGSIGPCILLPHLVPGRQCCKGCCLLLAWPPGLFNFKTNIAVGFPPSDNGEECVPVELGKALEFWSTER